MIHDLKCLPKYFVPTMLGRKKFEYRYNDRNFQIGDLLILREWENGCYTGREIYARVIYLLKKGMLSNIDIADGYCIMSIEIERMAKEQELNNEDS